MKKILVFLGKNNKRKRRSNFLKRLKEYSAKSIIYKNTNFIKKIAKKEN